MPPRTTENTAHPYLAGLRRGGGALSFSRAAHGKFLPGPALLAGGLVAAVATSAAAGLTGFGDGTSTRDPGGPGPKPGGQ